MLFSELSVFPVAARLPRQFPGLALLAATALVAACFNPFAPELDTNSDLSNVITDQATPEETLQNFRYAYTFKDSLLYSDLLEDGFVFEFFDPNQGPSGSNVTWGRDVDLRTTGRIFRGFDVIDLKWLNTLFAENQNGLERRFVRFDLSLVNSDGSFLLTGTAIFTFSQDPEDLKWRILRWKDESDR